MSQNETNHLSTMLREAQVDIEDILTTSEAGLVSLGSEAAALCEQIESLSYVLAMLVEEKFATTRYCD